MNKVLVIAAHPDDEILGCGGTIANHVECGDVVQVIFVADGITVRRVDKDKIERHRKAGIKASQILGAQFPIFFDFPDNRIDTIPLLDIVQKIESEIHNFSPNIVYTHFAGDLNIDHTIVCRAVMTACRPQPNFCVKEIFSFEIPSSTGWYPAGGQKFEPNYFVEISQTLNKKLDALKIYEEEMRPYPHSRSFENVEQLARYRGASVGLVAAEGFIAQRILR